jgi:hypothetical protein
MPPVLVPRSMLGLSTVAAISGYPAYRREGRHDAFARRLVEPYASGEGPRDHKILHHAAVP